MHLFNTEVGDCCAHGLGGPETCSHLALQISSCHQLLNSVNGVRMKRLPLLKVVVQEEYISAEREFGGHCTHTKSPLCILQITAMQF